MAAMLRRRNISSTLSAAFLRRSFASRSVFAPSFAAAADKSDTGLYGFDILKTAKGFRRFADEAIERSDELVSHIIRLPPSIEVIRAMDEISDTVCSVVDSAELCRNTHPDKEFVAEAHNASLKMNEYLHILNTNHDLYNAVLKTEKEATLPTEEARRAAYTLRVDFEKGGIHLPAEKLERVNQLNTEIARLGREFGENIVSDSGYVDIFPASRIPKHVHHSLAPIYRTIEESEGDKSSVYKNRQKGFRIPTDPNTLSSILKWVSDAEVRKLSYITGNSVPHANLSVLDKVIAGRHELTEIMGYKSFTEFAAQQNMAASPEVVISFLQNLSQIVKDKAEKEFKSIQDFKIKACSKNGDLEPWDEAYFTGVMKSSLLDLDASVISSYFSLPQCIEGLKMLVESLFGATFCEVSLAHGETWHPDVVKFALHHPEEGDLGYLYLDLCSRRGKYPGCAHFAIKGGRRLSETEYQLPVVALVCNFSASPGSSTLKFNHWEVETLFHEFGHAIHSLLSRTEYQHLSGTRTALDLAETPAHIFEYYAWDYRVLKTFAKHYCSGDVIPEKLVKLMNAAKYMFMATEIEQQILFSMIDQTLFGEPSLSQDTISTVADLKKKYTRWKHVDGTHWHTRFNHLINYGGGYYSYLYARSFAATTWQKVCMDDPLSLNTGFALRKNFLQYGGAKDPAKLLKDFIGEDAFSCYKGGVLPNLSYLSKELELNS